MALFKKTPNTRAVFFLVCDTVLLSCSVWFAFLLRFEGDIPAHYSERLLPTIFVFVVVKIAVLFFFRIYKLNWSFFSIYEMWELVKALSVSFFVLSTAALIFKDIEFFHRMPRSVFVFDYFCSLILVSSFRMSKRFYQHILKNMYHNSGRITLVVGAGNAGEQIVRDMKRNPKFGYTPVGFIDDDPLKINTYIHGVQVYGGKKLIPVMVEKLNVNAIIIAIPYTFVKEVKDIISYASKAGITDIKTIPSLSDILNGKLSVADLKKINMEDLLGREQATVDQILIAGSLYKKRVLITGAGGSIGSELIRQVLKYQPERVIALDIDETELFHIEHEVLGKTEETRLCPVVADIRDSFKMQWIFENHKPQVVFHAAAYKHVPIMEIYPEEAIKTNIFGTKNVAEAALKYGAEQFVLVSTDKAVRPTNVMGATKRIAEKIIKELNGMGETRFVSVRFGNVVGSRGSVVPTFQKQINEGGPITVTHAEMTRYFMSIPEAVTLILQSGAMGEGGEVYVLEMGDPVKIIDMAKEMIRLSGLELDKDISILYTGVRRGEKMYEELLTSNENMEKTAHAKIFKAKDIKCNEKIIEKLVVLDNVVYKPHHSDLRAYLSYLVKSYKPEKYLLDNERIMSKNVVRKIDEYRYQQM